MELQRVISCAISFVVLFSLGRCEVTEVTESNFQSIIKEKKAMFLYATEDNCVKCKLLYHKFLTAAQTFEHDQDLFFGFVSDKMLLKALEVTSFPEIIYYEYGSVAPKIFRGGITSGALVKVITMAMKDPHRSVKRIHSLVLTQSTFHEIMDNDQQFRLLMLHEDNEGDIDLFEEMAETFDNDETVVLARINVDKEKKFRQNFKAVQYPAIYWYPKGDISKKKRYAGTLEVGEMVNFINKEAGLFRMKGGRLNHFAGMIQPIDEVLNKHGKDLKNIRNYDKIRTQVKTVIAKHPELDDELTNFYLRLLNEIEEGRTTKALDDAKERLYIRKVDLWPLQFDQVIRKRNIVSKFMDIIGLQLLQELTQGDFGMAMKTDYNTKGGSQKLVFHDEL